LHNDTCVFYLTGATSSNHQIPGLDLKSGKEKGKRGYKKGEKYLKKRRLESNEKIFLQ